MWILQGKELFIKEKSKDKQTTATQQFGIKCCCCFVQYQENKNDVRYLFKKMHRFQHKAVFLKSSELTPRLKTLNCIPCFTNLFRMHTWKRRDPEVIWPFSPDSATQQRVSTAWKHSQLPSRLLMHRWAVLLRVRKIIRKKTIFHTVVPPNPCCFCAGSRASQSTCQ